MVGPEPTALPLGDAPIFGSFYHTTFKDKNKGFILWGKSVILMLNMMGKTSKLFHRLDNIEDVEEFYEAIDRKHLNKSLSPERPYT